MASWTADPRSLDFLAANWDQVKTGYQDKLAKNLKRD